MRQPLVMIVLCCSICAASGKGSTVLQKTAAEGSWAAGMERFAARAE
jgi:hypothetical protein